MGRTFNTLIIGAGKIGALFDSPGDKHHVLTHAHAYKKHTGFNLIGFYDTNKTRAAAAAKKWGVKSFGSLSEAFNNNNIDVVSVAVPDQHHYAILKSLIKYRPKLVFVEKPLTTSVVSSEKIVRLYNTFRIPLLVNYNRRFTPEFIKERKRIKDRAYGKFIGGVGYYGKGILHNGSHLTNILRFLLGKITLDKIIDSEPDYFTGDPSVSAILNIGSEKFFMHHVNSKLYTIFEMDLLFQKARLRIIDSGYKIERHLKKKSPIFKNYYDVVKKEDINTSLGFSCYHAVDSIHKFLKGKSDLLSSGEETLKDLRLCYTISKKAKLGKKVLMFSNDLGGANMIFPLVKPLTERGYKVHLYGRGHSLYKYSEFDLKGTDIDKEVKNPTIENITKFIQKNSPSFIITGTSANDGTERNIWLAASRLNIPSFAILDTWINYEIRFSLDKDHFSFPTKICIVDDAARNKVFLHGLTEEMLVTTGNPYFEFLLQENLETIKNNIVSSGSLKTKDTINVLFVSEPVAKFYKQNLGSETYLGYTEKTIFTNLYKAVQKLIKKLNKKVNLIIKLHPLDDPSNYNGLIKKLGKNSKITISKIGKTKLTNWEIVNSADIICGMGSTLLIEAFLFRKPVINIYIGLKRDYPSMFDRTGMIKSVHSQSALNKKLLDIIDRGIDLKYNGGIIKNPIQKVISEMEEILWGY